MSYQPPSQPGETGGSSSGDYGSGGYSVPPPPPSGGYNPPPPSGYNAPPGGYGSSRGASTAPGGGNPSNLAHLPRSYFNAVFKPNWDTYASEIPNASWLKIIIGVAIVGVLGLLLGLVGLGSVPDASQFDTAIAQARAQGAEFLVGFYEFLGWFLQQGPAIVIATPLLTFLTFLLGAWIQHLSARTIGGAKEGNFMTHAYLASLSYVPLISITQFLNLLSTPSANADAAAANPFACIGTCILLIVRLYQIFCVGVSMQASYKIQGGRAQMSAFVPAILLIVVSICLTVVLVGLIAGSVPRR